MFKKVIMYGGIGTIITTLAILILFFQPKAFLNILLAIIVIAVIIFIIIVNYNNYSENLILKKLKEITKEKSKEEDEFLEKMKNEKIEKSDFNIYLIINTRYYEYSENEDRLKYKETLENEIDSNINLIGDYLYIVPDIYGSSCSYDDKDSIYYLLEDYKRLEPNYKELFFKIHIDDIKSYRKSGVGKYLKNTGVDIRTGDTTIGEKTVLELYYKTKDGKNKVLKFNNYEDEALNIFQILIPDKEKKTQHSRA